jgi:protein ImuB
LGLVPLSGGGGEVGRVDAPPSDAPPWPGVLPPPSPAAVHADPVPAELLDDRGRPVRVDGRGVLSAAPVALRVDGRGAHVAAWAGPWPVDERWWDPRRHRRRVRLQVVADDGVARLLVLESGCWRVAATYD